MISKIATVPNAVFKSREFALLLIFPSLERQWNKNLHLSRPAEAGLVYKVQCSPAVETAGHFQPRNRAKS
jgi:hypothetical protein